MPDAYDVEVALQAKRDAQEIYDYLHAESPTAAERWIDDLQARFDSLKHFPARCARVPEAPVLGVNWRHSLLGTYRIIFQIEAHRVLVLRVIHGARLFSGT